MPWLSGFSFPLGGWSEKGLSESIEAIECVLGTADVACDVPDAAGQPVKGVLIAATCEASPSWISVAANKTGGLPRSPGDERAFVVPSRISRH
jgi:hypothetical protein